MAQKWTPSTMGKKGGKARAKALSSERQSEIGRHAATVRWRKYCAAKKPAA